MWNPRKTYSYEPPMKLKLVGNRTWYYNYSITSKLSQLSVGSGEDKMIDGTLYEYIQVTIEGEPDYKKCVEAVIREYLTQSQEFDLINDYNRVLLGIITDEDEKEEITSKYKEYLGIVDEIKNKVKEDFK